MGSYCRVNTQVLPCVVSRIPHVLPWTDILMLIRLIKTTSIGRMSHDLLTLCAIWISNGTNEDVAISLTLLRLPYEDLSRSKVTFLNNLLKTPRFCCCPCVLILNSWLKSTQDCQKPYGFAKKWLYIMTYVKITQGKAALTQLTEALAMTQNQKKIALPV